MDSQALALGVWGKIIIHVTCCIYVFLFLDINIPVFGTVSAYY